MMDWFFEQKNCKWLGLLSFQEYNHDFNFTFHWVEWRNVFWCDPESLHFLEVFIMVCIWYYASTAPADPIWSGITRRLTKNKRIFQIFPMHWPLVTLKYPKVIQGNLPYRLISTNSLGANLLGIDIIFVWIRMGIQHYRCHWGVSCSSRNRRASSARSCCSRRLTSACCCRSFAASPCWDRKVIKVSCVTESTQEVCLFGDMTPPQKKKKHDLMV